MLSAEDSLLLDDPKYRQYIYLIEKALKNFESSSEWADLISALGKLNKVLNTKYKTIPKKITIGKRLAQCMHPALPGGVHLKALDVYESIFKIIETKRLQADLYIYSMGIFPLLVNASMQVRPVLLNIYETYFLPLGNSLLSCIDGMLLGLLPGLEEGTEYFDRTDILLIRVCERVGQLEFYSALWRCILSSSFTRLAAVQLILRRFDRKKSTDDQLFIIGSDIEVMVYALCESLQDNSVLTQRASLDVLILCCPLSKIPISRDDCCELLLAALQCLLRRDMSLNRRLYSWLLGYDQVKLQTSSANADLDKGSYFDIHAKTLLTEAFLQMLDRQIHRLVSHTEQVSVTEELFPLKLLVSLLDKQEIGPAIIEDVLTDVFRLLKAASDYVEWKSDKMQNSNGGNDDKASRLIEISKTASLLLNVFEPGYTWQFLSQLLSDCEKEIKSRNNTTSSPKENMTSYTELCDFILLLLNITNLESYQEVQTIHLPNVLYNLVRSLAVNITCMSSHELIQGLKTCSRLLDLSQPMQPVSSGCPLDENRYAVNQASIQTSDQESCDNGGVRTVSQCFQLFLEFYCNFVYKKFKGNRTCIDRCIMEIESKQPEQDIVCSEITHLQGKEAGENPLNKSNNGNITVDADLTGIYQMICRLLLDFACFPLYCNGQSTNRPLESASSCDNFPEWLKCLLWCVCECSRPVYAIFEICSISVSTLLDLMSLTNSVAQKSASGVDCETTEVPCVGTVSVVVLSPLTYLQVTTLTNQTRFYQYTARRLWNVLGDEGICQHHLSSVQLLHRLHSMCRDTRCEDVLLEDMMHQSKGIRISALKKFCRLWLHTRTLSSKKIALQSEANFSYFTRCLFATVDSLSPHTQYNHSAYSTFVLSGSGRSVAMTIAASWLWQCLEEGDLLRILDPFFMVLLHPRTHSSHIFHQSDAYVESNTEQSLSEKEYIPCNKLNYKFSVGSDCIVMSDIAKGKMQYRNLLLSLTASNTAVSEEVIELKAQKIVEEIIKEAFDKLKEGPPKPVFKQDEGKVTQSQELNKRSHTQHLLKSVMLLYQENFDAYRVLYSLRSIHLLHSTHPKLFTYAAATSQFSLYTSQSLGGATLQDLLSRHLQVLSGRSFYAEVMSRTSNFMIVDVIIIICLRYIRSWHPDDEISQEVLQDIRHTACNLMLSLLEQMTDLARENFTSSSMVTSSSSTSVRSQQFGPFLHSVLHQHHVNEMILEALATTVFALHIRDNDELSGMADVEDYHVTVSRSSVTLLSEEKLAFWWSGNSLARIKSFHTQLLALVRALIVFNHHLGDTESYSNQAPLAPNSEVASSTGSVVPSYDPELGVACQPLFLTSLVRVLRLQSACDVHAAWLDILTSSLPYLNKALPVVTFSVISQLCKNLEHAADLYTLWNGALDTGSLPPMPPGYVIMLLKALRTLTHFTLLLHSGSVPLLTAGQNSKFERVASNGTTNGTQLNNNSGIFALGSIFNVFSFATSSSLKTQRSMEDQVLSTESVETRKITLKNLPRILTCLAIVWDKVVTANAVHTANSKNRKSSPNFNPCIVMGDSESVSQNVLQLLNPLAVQYGENLLSGLAIVWDRKSRVADKQDFFSSPQVSEQHLQLLNVACGVRALHCDVTLNLVRQVIMQPSDFPSKSSGKKRKTPTEECLLEFSLLYLRRQTATALKESWSSLLSLVRDCVALGPAIGPMMGSITPGSNSTGKRQLNARCYFFLLLMLSEYTKKIPSFEDKKDQKDLQDICVKCIEACNAVVDCSLEHGSWLARRSPSVLSRSQEPVSKSSNQLDIDQATSMDSLDSTTTLDMHPVKSISSDPCLGSPTQAPSFVSLSMSVLPQTTNPYYKSSVEALSVLAQVVANLLDVIYGSEEKEKTVPVLTPVMTNVTPFLKSHRLKNSPSYIAAACLLSSVSGYQQTRRAWKRDALDLFLTADFFRMPVESVSEWRNIIDHLMTHDATTFKELMVRIGLSRNTSSGPSLNIFSNKEAELEQRAMLLKRLAFVIFSSGVNQYQRYLPEIQERLSESLKLHQIPVVQEQIFLCFRVLLARVSPQHLTSLWPSIITELVQVMGQLEQELLQHDLDVGIDECEENTTKSKSAGSTPTSSLSMITSSSLSLCSSNVQEKWMKMYLSACKLLDLVLILQSNHLTYFKMFRWSFVGEPGDVIHDVSETSQADDDLETDENSFGDEGGLLSFVPHCVRIKRLLAKKRPSGKGNFLDVVPLRPLLNMRGLTSLLELQPFFNTIASPNTMLNLHKRKLLVASSHATEGPINCNSFWIEEVLEGDFVESMS